MSMGGINEASVGKNQHEFLSAEGIFAKQLPEVQDIVKKDPILSKNVDQITNPKEFFQKLTENAYIFEKSDNLSAQKTFLEQSLKGLEYGQYTKDGRKFEYLKPEDVKGLSDGDYDKYHEWKNDNLNTKLIAEEQRLAENKAGRITEEQRLAENKAGRIKLGEINKIAGEEIGKIQSTLSQEGKKQEEQFFQEAKQNPNNPIYLDLVTKGIDPSKGEFDNILRASIILANASTLRKESSNQGQFDNSIRELGKLGIPYPIAKDMPSISAHIDSRFPRGESTERAKGEIKKSIESGNIASIYYDGKGEKYTLIDRDGKTSKEVYMDPPRTQVMRNGLYISHEIAPTIVDPARERNATKRTTVSQIISTIPLKTSELLSGKMSNDTGIISPAVGGMISNTLSHINLKTPRDAELSRTMIDTTGGVLQMEQDRLNMLIQDKSKINPSDPDIGAIQGSIARLTDLMRSFKNIKEKTNIEVESSQDNSLIWDQDAQSTLSTLTDLGYSELGQDNLESLIHGLRVRDGKKGIWSNPELDMTDSFVREKQVQSLRRFSEQSGGVLGLQRIAQQIRGDEGFRQNWNNSESWIAKSETPIPPKTQE